MVGGVCLSLVYFLSLFCFVSTIHDLVKNLFLSRTLQAKKANRDSEKASPEAGLPSGTTWEKVSLLINHAHDKIHTKDLARFKSTLAACKTLNVPVAAK